MSRTSVQVNFKLQMPIGEYLALCRQAAPAIAQVPGLESKLFTLDEDEAAAGGIYVFVDRASADAYVAGPFIGGLRNRAGVTELSIRAMAIEENLSRITSKSTGRTEEQKQ